ncbi:hypothetical protein [Gynuella sunshinyii]|uniref:Uncharacterized protein n=1 Tax=Gynuella sunshinyii YC6258 TaxID=1445510 RepID=A0A0C5VS87_9GAMM|nr:hypothetical protein [Gynuella sunshinyii]AJQ97086.1 hypothetical Protein YC6258_05056 [Gynuella sunshinyii YC6258]
MNICNRLAVGNIKNGFGILWQVMKNKVSWAGRTQIGIYQDFVDFSTAVYAATADLRESQTPMQAED